MAETTFANPEPDPRDDGWLGSFHREPAVFSVFREVATAHPLTATEHRIECNDGAGPRVICRFFDESDPTPEWFGAWKGDEWSPWILKRARALIAKPDNT